MPEADFSNEQNRAIGLGVMGFTDVIEKLGFSYESEEAYDLIDEIMEHVSYARDRRSRPTWPASVARTRTSRARGWSKGLVPFDSIALTEADRGMPIKVNRTTRLDWDALREKVKGGMRNATLMAIAPTASIGLVAGTTPGLDPQFSQIFSRATSNGKFLEVNRNLVEDLQELGLWEQTSRGDPAQRRATSRTSTASPTHLKDVYKTSFQLSPYAFLEVAARAQKWIDQAISRNMYLETRDLGDMMDIYFARVGARRQDDLLPAHEAAPHGRAVHGARSTRPRRSSVARGRGSAAAAAPASTSARSCPPRRGFGGFAKKAE